jgi:hypothetical protein
MSITIDLDNVKFTTTADQHLTNLINNLSSFFSGSLDDDREKWVMGIWKHFTTSFPGYGVMVIHKGQVEVSGSDNFYKHFHMKHKKIFGTEGFEIYVVKKESGVVITNTGEGGFMNWCFSGETRKNGKVVFY